MKPTVSTPFVLQKTAIWQTTFVSVSSASLVNVCSSTALTALWVHHSQIKPSFNHLLLVVLPCDLDIHRHFCGIAQKKESKGRSHSLRTRELFRNQSWADV
jgi:hypothetical protein